MVLEEERGRGGGAYAAGPAPRLPARSQGSSPQQYL